MLQSVCGLLVIVGVCWYFSENKSKINWRLVIGGLVIQFILALLFIKIPLFQDIFLALNTMLLALETATKAGTSFVFGYLGGGELPFDAKTPGGGFILAFQALPLVLVISALSSLLFYWRILPLIVKGLAFLLEKSLSVGGAVSLGVAANIFVGMIEAPLFIRPYLQKLGRGELFLVMSCGMATIAGTMMVLYASILNPVIPGALGHILTASMLSAPAVIVISALLIPLEHETAADLMPLQQATSSMDAITQGTLQGVQLLLNIVAMLVVFIALVSVVNQILALLPTMAGDVVSLQRILGYLFAPLMWLIGIPWSEAVTCGALMGIKTILNEFVAYIGLAQQNDSLSQRSQMIMLYSLCVLLI